MSESSGSNGGIELGIPGYGPASEIGRGGFGTVYRAEQLGMGREVAVKVLPGISSDEQRRFEAECSSTGTLSDHPNIVSVYGNGQTADGRPWLAMQLGSRSLADQLVAEGPIEWPAAVSTIIKLAGALETAHRAGILHRDIKPANVLLSAHGEPALADFGIARARGASETTSSSITGTVEHTAPEVLSGAKAIPGSDVYSLASTLFALLTGWPPFRKDGDEGLAPLMMRVVSEPPPDLRPEGLPAAVANVLEQALAKSDTDRFSTAEAFGVALQEAEAALGLPVTPMTVHGEPREWESSGDGSPEGATRARVRPVSVPTPTPVAEAEPDRQKRKRAGVVALAVVGAAALIVGLLVAVGGERSGDELAASAAGASGPERVTLDLGVVRSRATGLDVHRVWTLAGDDGEEFESKVTLTNSTEVPVAAHDEVVPKELAAHVVDIDFEPMFAEVVQADPVVRYAVNLAPGASFEFAYTIQVDADGVSEERLQRWQRAQLAAQNAYDNVASDAPAEVIEEGGVIVEGGGELASGTGGGSGGGGSDGGGGEQPSQPAPDALYQEPEYAVTPTTATPTTQPAQTSETTTKQTTTTAQATTTTTTAQATTTTTTTTTAPPPPQNQAPTAYDNTSASIGFGSNESGTKCWSPLVINPLANDSDPEGHPLTAVWVRAYDSNGAGLALGGSVIKSFNSQGNPHVCLTSSYASKVNSLKIEYRARDSQGALSNVALITIPVFRR